MRVLKKMLTAATTRVMPNVVASLMTKSMRQATLAVLMEAAKKLTRAALVVPIAIRNCTLFDRERELWQSNRVVLDLVRSMVGDVDFGSRDSDRQESRNDVRSGG